MSNSIIIVQYNCIAILICITVSFYYNDTVISAPDNFDLINYGTGPNET